MLVIIPVGNGLISMVTVAEVSMQQLFKPDIMIRLYHIFTVSGFGGE